MLLNGILIGLGLFLVALALLVGAGYVLRMFVVERLNKWMGYEHLRGKE